MALAVQGVQLIAGHSTRACRCVIVCSGLRRKCGVHKVSVVCPQHYWDVCVALLEVSKFKHSVGCCLLLPVGAVALDASAARSGFHVPPTQGVGHCREQMCGLVGSQPAHIHPSVRKMAGE
jgi:hypothetical protein